MLSEVFLYLQTEYNNEVEHSKILVFTHKIEYKK